MAATPTGKGYWLVASDGGIFCFGDAKFHGSTGGIQLNKPIVGMAATPTGKGYWLVRERRRHLRLRRRAVLRLDRRASASTSRSSRMAATPTGKGYWLVRERRRHLQLRRREVPRCDGTDDGRRCVGFAPTRSGNGYWMAAADGTVAAFGDAPVLGRVADLTSVLVA